MNAASVGDELTRAREVRDFVASVERDVRAGRRAPGDLLDLDRDADRLGTSPARLRWRLRELGDRRLLVDRPDGRLVVAPVDTGDLDQILGLRARLEPEFLADAIAALPRVRTGQSPPADLPGDWQDDRDFAAVTDVFVQVVWPRRSRMEIRVFTELVAGTERAVRIGFGMWRRQHPGDLEQLAELLWNATYAALGGDAGGAREACRRTHRVIRELAWQGALGRATG